MPRQLVVQLARFGDLVQSKRLILSLAARGETHLCVDRGLAPLARLLYPQCTVHALPAHGNAPPGEILPACRETLAALRALNWDAVYNLNYSGLNLALSTCFPPDIVHGHQMVAGQARKSPWAELGFRWTARRRTAPLNLVDFWAWTLQPGQSPFAAPLEPDLVNPPARPGGQGLGVVLAGREARRSLPLAVLVPLVQAALQGTGARRAVLLGGAAERPAARAFLKNAPPALAQRCEDLCGKTDWQGLITAVQGLDLLLTPDTGTMHLAAHLGVPVLAVFLSSAWAWETGPYGLGHRVLQAVTDCAPCVESAPCTNELVCLPPFAAKETLRAVARGLDFTANALPPGLLPLATDVDALGQVLRPLQGADPAAIQREALRGLLAEQLLGLAPQPGVQATAETFFLERDWLLPPHRNRASALD